MNKIVLFIMSFICSGIFGQISDVAAFKYLDVYYSQISYKSEMYVLNGSAPPVNSFQLQINTVNGTDSTFQLPLYSGYNYNFTVSWGDGEISYVTSYDDADASHKYSTSESVTISISGTCPSWGNWTGSDSDKITSVVQWGDVGFVYLEKAFYSASNLASIQDADSTFCKDVTNFSYMFSNIDFNPAYIVSWDVGSGTDFSHMFDGNYTFNQDIGGWDVGSGTDFSYMFQYGDAFNQDISGWDMSSATNLNGMLYDTPDFDQDLSTWDISSVTSMDEFKDASYFSTANYSAMLIAWAALSVQSGVTASFGSSTYSSSATTARSTLVNTYSWTISDGGLE